jgi:hypothetical protein
MNAALTAVDLVQLVHRVFAPTAADTGLAILVDLPDGRLPDNPAWRARRALAVDWAGKLRGALPELGLPRVDLVWYRNVGSNNADLPGLCVPAQGSTVLDHADELAGRNAIPFAALFAEHSLVLAPTELSATAPLKVAVREFALRAATMPGFLDSMVPALRIDYVEVNRRVDLLRRLVDPATGADLSFRVGDAAHTLHLDLRHRTGHASGGLFPANGVAGNLPSGETYIVPYEGERAGDPSRSAGELPVQFGDEVVVYRIAGNKAVEVLTQGPASAAEARRIADEPAYANLAELGLGVLGGFGLEPCGSILLDEKLGLHVAFGRSDHFGGTVGPLDFSSPGAVVHVDRVYIPAVQPQVAVASVTLRSPDGDRVIMRNGAWEGVF